MPGSWNLWPTNRRKSAPGRPAAKLGVEALEARDVPTAIIVNELYRGGNLTTTDEFIELLVTVDLTADQLNSFYVGDSTGTKNSKFSAYDFTGMGAIASAFPAGTIIAVGGTGRFAQDTSYNPAGGDYTILLTAGGSFLPNANAGNAGDLAENDIAWVDTAPTGSTISPDGFAVDIGTGTGPFTAAASVNLGVTANNTGVRLDSDLAGAVIVSNWTLSVANASVTPGLPNGGANTTYINSLRNVTPPAALFLSVSPTSISENGGSATGTVTRTGATTADLTVTLASNDTTEATVPASVTILAGRTSATFAVTAVDDAVVDGSQAVTLTASAAGLTAGTATLTVTDDDVVVTPIYTIQGSGTASPFANQTGITTEGIVVADFQGSTGQNGFYIQDPTGDGDVNTSDGIFVFVPAANPLSNVNVNVGDRVRLTGRVVEFNTLTEFDNLTALTVLSTGNPLPAAAPVSLPATDAELERVEGMRVGVTQTLTVSQNFFSGRFGQLTLSSGGRLVQPTQVADGGSAQFQALRDDNARRLLVLDDGSNAQNPTPTPYLVDSDGDPNTVADRTLRAGDTVRNLTGVLDFGPISSDSSVRDYRLQPTAAPEFTRVNPRTAEPDLRDGNLTVSSFNVLNYFTTFGGQGRGADNQAEFDRQKAKIVAALAAIDADVFGLIEIENLPATDALGNLLAALNAEVGANTYAAAPAPPQGTGSDAIKVAMIYKPARVQLVGAAVSDPDPINNRPTLAQTVRLTANGETLTVVVNHFKSKSPTGASGADLDQGDGQGAFNAQRTAQAQRLLQFINGTVLTRPGDPAFADPDVLVIGDLNAYAEEDPIQVLRAGGYEDQIRRFVADPYSFVFDGQSGYLDHALTTTTLSAQVADVTEWHINADEPEVLNYDTSFKQPAEDALFAPTPYRSSDHDPVVVSLNLGGGLPANVGEVRFAQFNASLNRAAEGQLVSDLSLPANPDAAQQQRIDQARRVAEVIQRTNPDVVLINEFDYVADGSAARLFRDNFLNASQNTVGAGATGPVYYPYFYIAPSNTGIASNFDLNNNGVAVTTPGAPGYGDDALGFGNFPGQFGMVLFSKFPILTDQVRTFQNFLWRDMPGNRIPDGFYDADELDVLPLSSKSHWDVPVLINGQVTHVLASHPTPPVFDGPEDRNGRRNADEIRLFADYITPGAGGYIYDDRGRTGGLPAGRRFVLMGDQNSDPFDGDSVPGAIQQLLDNPRVNATVTPDSPGGRQQGDLQGNNNRTQRGDPRFDTADFADTGGNPGNLRADYVLPSSDLFVDDAGVFWPAATDPLFGLVGTFSPSVFGGFPTSDHRLVFVDVVDPFVNGVAAGDTTDTTTVLWAHTLNTGTVQFEVATDEAFANIIQGFGGPSRDPAVPVKFPVAGLTPGTQYYYRVTDPNGATAFGRFRTAAAAGTYAGTSFGVTGDWRGELSPYPGIANADAAGLDFFVGLGDTIYADFPSPDLPAAQARTLAEFRTKHNEVYRSRLGLNTFADLRAVTSTLATIDDHEVTNDFAGFAPISSDPRFAGTGDPAAPINDSTLFENGLRAFQEYNPLRDEFYPDTGADPRMDGERKLYRFNRLGADAATFVLDTRSFRDGPLTPANLANPADVARFLGQAFDPSRTLLGRRQVDELKADLLAAQRAGVTWKFVMVPEPIQNLGVVGAGDRFEGYAAERAEILRFVNENGISNVVFVAADIHGTVVNDLSYQNSPGGPQVRVDAFEVTTGSLAFAAPFGPTVVQLAAAQGILSPELVAFYDTLSRPQQDQFVRNLIDGQLNPLGYSPVGLDDPASRVRDRVTLTAGDYVATHTYGWTEFDVDPNTQVLTVTTWGIPFYTEAQVAADPALIQALVPAVVSQFTVAPRAVSVASVGVNDTAAGTSASKVAGATVTFTGRVDTTDLAAVASAFTVTTAAGAAVPGLTVSVASAAVADGRTVVRLAFAGAAVTGGSLADGRYALRINGAGLGNLFPTAQAVDAARTGTAGSVGQVAFQRFAGDVSGDGLVSNADLAAFRRANGSVAADARYVADFDFDGDNDIDAADANLFLANYRRRSLS